MSRQVRLDDDVADVIARSAERHERSMSAEANVWLRRVIGLQPAPGGAAEAVAPHGAIDGPDPRHCWHPPTRRIGPTCTLCGKTLSRTSA